MDRKRLEEIRDTRSVWKSLPVTNDELREMARMALSYLDVIEEQESENSKGR